MVYSGMAHRESSSRYEVQVVHEKLSVPVSLARQWRRWSSAARLGEASAAWVASRCASSPARAAIRAPPPPTRLPSWRCNRHSTLASCPPPNPCHSPPARWGLGRNLDSDQWLLASIYRFLYLFIYLSVYPFFLILFILAIEKVFEWYTKLDHFGFILNLLKMPYLIVFIFIIYLSILSNAIYFSHMEAFELYTKLDHFTIILNLLKMPCYIVFIYIYHMFIHFTHFSLLF